MDAFVPPSRLTVGELWAVWAIYNRLSWKEIAAKLGATTHAVTKWRHGKRKPSRRFANAIERLTDGKIPATLWDDELSDDQQRAA